MQTSQTVGGQVTSDGEDVLHEDGQILKHRKANLQSPPFPMQQKCKEAFEGGEARKRGGKANRRWSVAEDRYWAWVSYVRRGRVSGTKGNIDGTANVTSWPFSRDERGWRRTGQDV